MTAMKAYLGDLKEALEVLPEGEREPAFREVEAHLHEVLAQHGEEAVATALDGFGPAQLYVASLAEAHELSRSYASRRLGHMLFTVFVFAARSATLTLAATVAFVLAITAIGLAGVAVADIIAPQATGLFTGDGRVVYGVASGADAPVEHLGRWIILISAIGSALSFWAAFKVVQAGVSMRLSTLNRRLAP